ncbi:hypothetical protein [Candidatus Methylobacter oryzae]|uniref:Uncharacterized protein n=1 Tax=Candidatus Methylobacter oryzae TaxID=2497749 RepID=A0ABY3CBZ5_9GAMM|nr:hypothetical protein [Candidatus Methylobacter oryzae]TRW97167.1 hypothetical protein EKO24_007820 [Candidatus Methylobacter oryzae]
MQAIELEATITESHEIHLQLPDNIKASKAKVIVMYDEAATPVTKKRVFGQYRDKITIAETFDDELPVSFWLGDKT